MYDEEAILLRRGYEQLVAHSYIKLMNPVCIFGHKINKEQLKGWYEYWKYKKIPYSSKAILCVEIDVKVL